MVQRTPNCTFLNDYHSENSYSAPVVKIHLEYCPETVFLKCRLIKLQISSYLLKLLDTIFKTPVHHLISIL